MCKVQFFIAIKDAMKILKEDVNKANLADSDGAASGMKFIARK